MVEIFEAGNWKVFPKKSMNEDLSESYIEFVFRLKNDFQQIRSIQKENLQELKKDLQDLGKWRRYKELKKDLEK